MAAFDPTARFSMDEVKAAISDPVWSAVQISEAMMAIQDEQGRWIETESAWDALDESIDALEQVEMSGSLPRDQIEAIWPDRAGGKGGGFAANSLRAHWETEKMRLCLASDIALEDAATERLGGSQTGEAVATLAYGGRETQAKLAALRESVRIEDSLDPQSSATFFAERAVGAAERELGRITRAWLDLAVPLYRQQASGELRTAFLAAKQGDVRTMALGVRCAEITLSKLERSKDPAALSALAETRKLLSHPEWLAAPRAALPLIAAAGSCAAGREASALRVVAAEAAA